MTQRHHTPRLAPAGNATLIIVSADVRDVPWRASNDNPAGSCLSLGLSAGSQYEIIRSDLPLDHKRLLEQLAESVGCDQSEMSPEFLVGKSVTTVVNHFIGRSGVQKAGVGKWLPAELGREQHQVSRNALRHPTANDRPS